MTDERHEGTPVDAPHEQQPAAAGPAPQPTPHLVRGGTGTPTLLLHGWGASSDLFAATMRGLGDGFDLIAPDFPGFGATEPPPVPWGVGEYVAWTLALMDWLGVERPNLVGHSFGGRVAIKLAALHPERVARLTLTDAAGIRPQRTWRYHVQVRTFKTWRALAQSRYTPQPLRAWAAAQVAQQGSPDYKAASGTVRGSFVRVVNEDLRDYLPRIQAPTLLIWGDRDEETPLADGQLMERMIPDAGLVVFEGAGHYAYLEQSGRFCVIVKTFLEG
ncbi:MAG TPA: alpha/beta hydrolase [Ktedonobacterales bacterium]|jgi:pimeloyl-ACP methyl ester carboxylesterase